MKLKFIVRTKVKFDVEAANGFITNNFTFQLKIACAGLGNK